MKVHEFKMINRGSTVAAFNLEFESIGLVLVDCRLVEGKNGRFVSFPARQFESGGVKKYKNLVRIDDKDKAQKVQAAALKTLEPYLVEQPASESDTDQDLF